jgi:hypothetical protein
LTNPPSIPFCKGGEKIRVPSLTKHALSFVEGRG